MNKENQNWLHDLFIEEAKAAKDYHNRGGSGGEEVPTQQKVVYITENGTVEVTPDYGYTLSKVTANVNVDGNAEVFAATSDVEIFVVTTAGAFTLQDVSAELGGNGNVAIQLVNTLPEKLIVSDAVECIYVYVVESTGTAYANFGGGNVAAGMMVFMDDAFNKGWTTDINSVTEQGVYCVRKNSGLVDVDHIDFALVGDENCVYRLTAGLYFNHGGRKDRNGKTYIVDKLPEVGEPCTLDGQNINVVYYNTSDEVLYAYISDEIEDAAGTTAGWYEVEPFLQSFGDDYEGSVTNFASMTVTSVFYFLANTAYFIYKDGNWVELCAYCGDSGGGDSGDDDGDSPSCLVVVGNYSADAFEVTVKMLVENNEVVDNTGLANGHGEYAEFHNTQKGSVATLKTTLPVIVRDGYNPDIIYSNSEYVEVDEANQMTYITIPMDSAVVEIVVGE